ncbi:GNAT family N-acetyltransferase [Rhodococcus opacus]|uniref:GNAT family N-acetyltransferase n=1 Tax=Rhodococcus opacus TaxID=37919 RepID=A0AAX3YE21_RHOOP|nr:GNAT family N-acetyltransferase [Rhodococcus opacus]MCZ4588913.1 GNAT family N-acetyltransferase [Rhodococcus opacus]WLF47556.1 GNAT family N-acetyltransferase [Rhodococcus opacus]
MSADAVTFEFVRTTREFFPQLQRWLREPHVARFWNHDTADADIERDFGGSIDGTEPCEDFLVRRDGLPFGFIQRYRIADYPEDLALLAALVEIPPGSISIDYYVGGPQHTGQGLGTAMISAFVAKCRADLPDATAIVVPVVVPNRASWRALEKAGFRRVGEGYLPPDNPIDDGAHYISRLDLDEGRPIHPVSPAR